MKGKKIKSILLIAVFIISTLAIAIPVSAQIQTVVWVDDGFLTEADVTAFNNLFTPPLTLVLGTDAFDTIQEGIDAVDTSGTVNVRAGTYTEKLTIDVAGLILLGPNEDIDPNTGDRVAEAIIDVDGGTTVGTAAITISASGVNINGFKIIDDNTDQSLGISSLADNTIDECVIEYNIIQYYFLGVHVQYPDNWIINNNLIHARGNAVLLDGGSGHTVDENTVTSGSIQVPLSDNVLITNNILTNPLGAGVTVTTTATKFTITGNTFIEGDHGIGVFGAPHVDSVITENNFYGNVRFAVHKEGTGTLNAELNWWGDPAGPRETAADPPLWFGVGDKIQSIAGGSVDYTPWYSAAIEMPLDLEDLPTTTDTYDAGNVGDKVTVSGTDATLLGRVRAYWDGLEDIDELTTTPAIVKADGFGAFDFSITVPEDVAGIHHIVVKDMESEYSELLAFTMIPEIVLDPKAGITGDTITVTGTGFKAATEVSMTYTKTGETSTKLITSPSIPKTSSLGSFTCTFIIPTDAMTGDITATAYVTDSVKLTVGTCITLTPKTGITGTTVTIVGRDFTPTDIIDVRWVFPAGAAYLTLIDDYKIGSTGGFTKTFIVPPVDPGTYTVSAALDTDPENPIAVATFKVKGVTKITLEPTADLAGKEVSVKGVWFTSGKTVTIYFDGVSVGTATAATTLANEYGFTKSITTPADATLGAHTIKAMDSEGVYATATFTVIEVVITIETRSASYDPGDTISFTIESTVAFYDDDANPDTFGAIAIEIDDPDGTIFWDLEWYMIAEPLPATGYYVPYSAQLDANDFHLTLPSDAETGIWTWTTEYYLLTASTTKLTATGTFTVGEPVGPQPDLPAETTDQVSKDSTGTIKTSFVLGETVLASAKVSNIGTQSQPMLIMVQWKDPQLHTLAPVFIIVELVPGQSFTYAPGVMLPLTGFTKGTWTAKVLVYDTWIAQGGVTKGTPVTITITVS